MDSGRTPRLGIHASPRPTTGNTTRKPLLLFRLSGWFLLRFAERQFLSLLLKEPPRRTREDLFAAVPAALEAAHVFDQKSPPKSSRIFGANGARAFGATKGLRPLDPHPSTRYARSAQDKV